MDYDHSLNDSLTGVFSRAYLYTRLNEEIKRATRYESAFSILLLDLDYFKSINDAFGHLKGDQVLIEFVHFLRAEVRNSDLLFRYGGDEFVILMPYTPKNKALLLAERLLEKIRQVHFGEKKSLNLTMSCGIATFPQDGNTAEDLFEVADQHHYLAKRYGRDCVVCDHPQTDHSLPLEDVSRLIERDEGMSAMREFLAGLPQAKRSVMRISGEPGLGISRFLQEVSKIARLSGVGVLALRGSTALENRKFSVLINALVENALVNVKESDRIFFASDRQDRLNAILLQWLDTKGFSGLLVTLDDLSKIDRASLDVLKGCFFASQEFPFGLVYADSGINAQQMFPFGIQPGTVVRLNPISNSGIQVWLRQSLRWDPPQEFVDWLAEKTNGYPALIQRGLEELIRSGVIKKNQTGLSLAENYRDESLVTLQTGDEHQIQGILFENPSTEFIGRVEEIYNLKRLILDERLVTVIGMGGVGKSRLAYQLALESQNYFANGALSLSLAGVEDDVSVTYVLAEALDIKLRGNIPEREQIARYLNNKEILILLDNIDHIQTGGELISYLLENTLAVHFLVTARERLDIRHEVVFELQGLNYPVDDDLQNAESYSSVQLFMQVAKRGRPDFFVQDSDWPFIVRICQRLSGVPLGIELAAAWVESLTFSEISSQFDQEQDLIAKSPNNHHSASRTLQWILNSLWERFSAAERDLLMGMAIFKGSFSRIAAQEVIGVSLFFLDALVNKSLLRHSGADRYMMHELICQQLLSRLENAPELNHQYRTRHAIFYLESAKDIDELIQQSREKETLSKISHDFENIRTAWNWAVQIGDYPVIQPGMRGLFTFFEQSGRFKEGNELFSGLLSKLSSDHHQQMSDELKYLNTLATGFIGKFEYHLGDYSRSQELLEIALTDFEDLGSISDIAHTRYALANLKRAQGEYEQARYLLNTSLKYYQEIGDERAQGDILNSLGVIASGLGEIDLAERYYSACLEKLQSLGDPGKISRAMNNLGYSFMEKGDYKASQPLLLKSLTIAQDIGAEPLTAAILDSVGALYFAMGDNASSIRYYREGLRLSVKLNTLPLVLEILLGFANIYSTQGKLEQASELMCMVYHHPSAVHEIRERAGRMLAGLEQARLTACLESGMGEMTLYDVDKLITNTLYTHLS